MKTIGIILLLLGVAITITTGLKTTIREISNVKPYQLSNPHKIAFYWSPITAIALITAGIIVLVIAKKETRIIHHR